MNFEARELRSVMGAFVTGVTVVTTLDTAGQPQGVTANSFTSVSLDPPLVLWSQATTAKSFPVFRDAERFVINILALDQLDVSQQFARSGTDKFAQVATRPGIGGLPVIEGGCAHLECRRVAMYPGGDHAIFVGQVDNISRSDNRPLVFGGGKYMVAFAHDAAEFGNPGAARGGPHIEAVRLGGVAVADVSRRLGVMLGLGVWGNQGPTIVRWEPGPQPLSEDLRVGTVVSPVSSATGLAFTAFLPRTVTATAVASELAAMSSTASLHAEQAAIEARIAEVRQRGWARSPAGQFKDDIAAVSVPVYDAGGQMVLALTAVAPTARFGHPDPLGAGLLREAALISHQLGHRPNARH